MFLDSAYVAKFYVNERDSAPVREVIRSADSLCTSAWSVVEVTCAIHRHLREGALDQKQFQRTLGLFRKDSEAGMWRLIPVSEIQIRRVASKIGALPAGILLRAGDAVQLASAVEAGEQNIWSNDRHLLAAAPHFGLTGRTA